MQKNLKKWAKSTQISFKISFQNSWIHVLPNSLFFPGACPNISNELAVEEWTRIFDNNW